MTKDEFLTRFTLLQLNKSEHNYQHHSSLNNAAVLIVLVEKDKGQGLDVLLTKRAKHLKHHPSQVSFPGGKVDKEDLSIIDTALRETYEEVGIATKAINIIGQLPPYQTVSGFNVTPVIGLVSEQLDYQVNTNEVEEAFHVPLKHLLSTKSYQTFTVTRKGQQHNVHFLPYKHYNIWGATAVILKDLVNQIS